MRKSVPSNQMPLGFNSWFLSEDSKPNPKISFMGLKVKTQIIWNNRHDSVPFCENFLLHVKHLKFFVLGMTSSFGGRPLLPTAKSSRSEILGIATEEWLQTYIMCAVSHLTSFWYERTQNFKSKMSGSGKVFKLSELARKFDGGH